MRLCVGIDPGLDGGFAAIDNVGRISSLLIMPTVKDPNGKRIVDGASITDWFNSLAVDPSLVAIERVWGRPGQGVTAAFSFGLGTGIVLGIVQAFRYPLLFPTPQTWQGMILKGYGRKKTKRDTKEASLAYFQARHPEWSEAPWKKHDGISDAVCIAEFARLRQRGIT